MEKIVKPAVQKMNLADLDNKAARKMIAQDILSYLDAKYMVACKGSYVIAPDETSQAEAFAENPLNGGISTSALFVYSSIEQVERSKDSSAQEYIEAFPVCGVCAIGSLLVATLLRFNAVTLRELGEVAVNYRTNAMQYLQKLFTPVELGMMEACFEKGDYVEWMLYEDQKLVHDSDSIWRGFFDKFQTPDERLRGIMQNILDNDGEFKPETSI